MPKHSIPFVLWNCIENWTRWDWIIMHVDCPANSISKSLRSHWHPAPHTAVFSGNSNQRFSCVYIMSTATILSTRDCDDRMSNSWTQVTFSYILAVKLKSLIKGIICFLNSSSLTRGCIHSERLMHCAIGLSMYWRPSVGLSVSHTHELQWLPIRQRITFKTAVLVHKCQHGATPQYLQLTSTCTGRRHLRSQNEDEIWRPKLCSLGVSYLEQK